MIAEAQSMRHPSNICRTALAALLAGPLGAVIHAVLWSLWYAATSGSFIEDLVAYFGPGLPSLLWWTFWGAVIGWPAMLLGGLPAHLIFYRLGWHVLWPYIPAGAMVGAIATLTIGQFIDAPYELTWLHDDLLRVGMTAGSVSAVIFWLIRRPDHDSKYLEPAQ